MTATYALPDGTAARLTEAVMLSWLRRRYIAVHGNGPRWVFATHVKDAPGFYGSRTADAVAMDMWNSKGLELHGHEVKVSRADWLRELRDPEKATAVGRYCDRWWLVVPDPSIVREGELPSDWGILVAAPDGCRAVLPAPKRKPVPVDRAFMAAMLRATAKTAHIYAGQAAA